jgi:hypothetical protein
LAALPARLSAAGFKAVAHHAGGAAAVSARVAALTEGVLQAMFMTSLKRALVLGLVVCCAAIGAGTLVYQVLGERPAAAREKRPADPARAVLERPVQALGGEQKLRSLPAVTWRATGTIHAGEQKLPVKFDGAAQGTGQIRLQLDAVLNESGLKLLIVLNGDNEWVHSANDNKGVEGKLVKLTKSVLDGGLRHELYGIRSAQMLLPFRDERVTLAPLGEIKIEDRPAVGVTVTRKGRPDLNLYFDKETGLPVKGEMQIKGAKDAQEVAHEFRLGDWKEFGGIKHFTTLTLLRDGQTVFEAELSDIKPQEKLQESTFSKPE